MKKILKFLLTTVLLSSASYGQADLFENNCCNDNDTSFSAAVQCAAFFPLDSDVHRIYGSALPAFTIEGNWQRECFGLWLNASYVFGNGHAYGGGGYKTHLNLVPISLGVKYIYSLCDSTDFYVGLGACYSFMNTRDHSEFVHERVSSNGFGGIVKTGLTYIYCENIFFEGFLNYTYQRFSFSRTSNDPFVYRRDVDLSSLQLGVGLGMKF